MLHLAISRKLDWSVSKYI